MNSTILNMKARHSTIKISEIFLCLIVAYSFIVQIIMNTLSGRAYCIGLVVLTLAYIFTTSIYKEKTNLSYLLVALALLVTFIGCLRSGRDDAFVDLITLFCGYLVVRCHGNDGNRYVKVLKIITFFGLFFSAGVLLQEFMPSLYKIIMRIFPSGFANAVTAGVTDSINGNRGFATNTGFSAGFICAGLLSTVVQSGIIKETKRRNFVLMAIMLIGLAFTGKRGSVIFVFLAIILYYLLPYRGNVKIKRYWRVFLVVLVLVVLYFVLRDVLASVPLMNEIIRTIEGLALGEDVTSSRMDLYLWAFGIFKEHPLFGIGWGCIEQRSWVM